MKRLLSKILAMAMVISLAHCQSIQEWMSPQPEPVQFKHYDPQSKTGCANVPGREWFKCMQELSMKWQAIESADPKTTVLDETRDGDWLLKTKQVCWSKYFCRYYIYREYDPKMTSLFMRNILPVMLAAGVGYGVGYAAFGPAGLTAWPFPIP